MGGSASAVSRCRAADFFHLQIGFQCTNASAYCWSLLRLSLLWGRKGRRFDSSCTRGKRAASQSAYVVTRNRPEAFSTTSTDPVVSPILLTTNDALLDRDDIKRHPEDHDSRQRPKEEQTCDDAVPHGAVSARCIARYRQQAGMRMRTETEQKFKPLGLGAVRHGPHNAAAES